jgi:hypothetical protein
MESELIWVWIWFRFGVLVYLRRLMVLAAKVRPGGLRRFTAAVALRVDCPAVRAFTAASRNSLRSLRSLRSDNRDESVDEARCARSRESCAPRRCRGAPQPARAHLCRRVVCGRHQENQKPTPARAPQRSRHAVRPPQCEPAPGADFRDASKPPRSMHLKTEPTLEQRICE